MVRISIPDTLYSQNFLNIDIFDLFYFHLNGYNSDSKGMKALLSVNIIASEWAE